MIKSALGNNGPLLPRLGYGAMVLEGFYGEAKHSSALSTLHHAMDQGIMIDTADAYGDGHNERLIGEVVQARKDDPFIATKFGIVFDSAQPSREIKTGWGFSLNINASPEYAQKALDDSLQRLGLDTINLWYMHYPDPSVPIEESVGAMADAVKQGKVRYLGLSNVTADQIRKASAIHPINAVQYEYSLWRREAESELLPTLRDLGIALVGWSPLGSGFLTGNLQKLDSSDFRNTNPKMRGENFDSNKARVEEINQIAARLNLTTAQVSLAWLLAQGDDIFPIPGTRRTSRIDENLLAASVDLTPDVIEEIDRLTRPGTFAGGTLLD